MQKRKQERGETVLYRGNTGYNKVNPFFHSDGYLIPIRACRKTNSNHYYGSYITRNPRSIVYKTMRLCIIFILLLYIPGFVLCSVSLLLSFSIFLSSRFGRQRGQNKNISICCVLILEVLIYYGRRKPAPRSPK